MRAVRAVVLISALFSAGLAQAADSLTAAQSLGVWLEHNPPQFCPVDPQVLCEAEAAVEHARRRLCYLENLSSESCRIRALIERHHLSPFFRDLEAASRDERSERTLENLEKRVRNAIVANVVERSLSLSLRTAREAVRSRDALREAVTEPESVKKKLEQTVTELKNLLAGYDAAPSKSKQVASLEEHVEWLRLQVASLEEHVEWLRLHRQAKQQVAKIETYYLRPVLRVNVSRALLNDVAGAAVVKICLDRTEHRVHLNGWVSTDCRLGVTTKPDEDRGNLCVGLCGPLEFNGTAQIGRVCIGVRAAVAVNVSKRLFLVQDAPEGAEPDADVRLLWTKTDRRPVVDGLIQMLSQRMFDGQKVGDEVKAEIDQTAAELTGLVNFRDSFVMRCLERANLQTPFRRRYRTYEGGAEFRLLERRDTLVDPKNAGDPPELTAPWGQADRVPSDDFRLVFRRPSTMQPLQPLELALQLPEKKPAGAKDDGRLRIEVRSGAGPVQSGELFRWRPVGDGMRALLALAGTLSDKVDFTRLRGLSELRVRAEPQYVVITAKLREVGTAGH